MAQNVDQEVTLADQTLINRFARLNAKCEELETDLTQKKRQLDNTCEAIDELVLQDQHVLVSAGEVFAKMDVQKAEEWCEDLKKSLEIGVKDIQSSVETMRAEMSEIKAKLYAKFGSNINLEYDDD